MRFRRSISNTNRVEIEEDVLERTGNDAINDVTDEVLESLQKSVEVDERTLTLDVGVPDTRTRSRSRSLSLY